MNKADNILQQQKELQKELEALQSKCEHSKQSIKQLPDKNEWWWQCTVCHKYTHYATQAEVIEYISK